MKWNGVVVASIGIAAIAVTVLYLRGAPDAPARIPAGAQSHPAPIAVPAPIIAAVARDSAPASPAAPPPAGPPRGTADAVDPDAADGAGAHEDASALADTSRPSEQFMHSRRDDGQHSE